MLFFDKNFSEIFLCVSLCNEVWGYSYSVRLMNKINCKFSCYLETVSDLLFMEGLMT